MRQNRELNGQRKKERRKENEDVVGIEIHIDCTSTGLACLLLLLLLHLRLGNEPKPRDLLSTSAVQAMMDREENNLDVMEQ